MNAQFKKGVLDLVVMVVVSQHDIMTNEKYFETYLVESTEGPPRKYYRITALGLTTMNQLKTEWLAFSKQLNLFLEGGTHDEQEGIS